MEFCPSVNFSDLSIIRDIKVIYENIKEIAEQTGATKIMALKNPLLFIMWDTEIRKIYGIKNKADSDDYLKFLKEMKNKFGHLKSINKVLPLAKVIDEYNYVIAEKRRIKQKKKKLKKRTKK